MASPKPIDASQGKATASAGAGVGSPSPAQPMSAGVSGVSIPNIPPRGSVPSSVNPARSLSTSFRPSSLTRVATAARRPSHSASTAASASGKPTPKASQDNLIGKKSDVNPASFRQASALTAQLGSSPLSTPRPPAAPSASHHNHSPSPSPKAGDSGVSRKASVSVRPGNERAHSGASTPKAGESSFSNLADVPDERKAEVLRRHLVSAEKRQGQSSKAATPTPGGGASPGNGNGGAGTPSAVVSPGDSGVAGTSGIDYGATGSGNASDDDQHFPTPFHALGGDVTHDLYKWQHDHRARPVRSASFSHVPLDRSAILDPTLAHIKEPGGFRRNFVVNRAQEQGLERPTVMRNVVDFLFLYGHFAGEDLGEDEDDETDEDGFPTLSALENGHGRLDTRRDLSSVPTERSLLLGPGSRAGSKTRHKRSRSGPGTGTASVTQATLMLLKGFVGTGILFMGKAFLNGGILFSSVVLLSIAAISLWAFLLLVQTYLVVPGSFGDIGGVLYGNYMRLIILASIAVSQIGFVAAYTIFIAENLQAFVLAVTNCKTYLETRWLIFAELIVFLPLAMIRNLAKLSGTALVADAFILIGLIYIGGNEISVLAHKGLSDIQLFNRDSFPLLIGTAVFAFEGIGLVIPITESMREPQKFPRILSIVMFVVAVLFAGFGVLGYAAYGSDIQTVVIVNLPQDDKFVQAVQFLYSVAILLSIPLQLFPAVRIMENGLFIKSGKHNPSVKWQKNVFRAATVVFCSLISWAGSSELDKFVSLIGAFACIPLCFIYPPMLHLRACARTRRAKFLDWTLLIFGILVGIYTTVQTIRSLFEPSEKARLGRCEVPT